MNNKLILKAVLAAVIVICFASCDKDFDEIGTGVIGDDHFDFEKNTDFSVVAYNHRTGTPQNFAVQTNNLPVNALGYYENPVFGNTTANFVSQVELPIANLNPTFGNNIEIDSVYFSLPYFSVKTASDADGAGTYELDSIYTKEGETAKFDLSVYESGYYINDFDPANEFEQAQRFYSNDNHLFDEYKKGANPDGSSGTARLNSFTPTPGHPWPQNDGFVFDNREIVTKVITDGDTTRTRAVPGMRLKLNPNYFKRKIFEAPADKLASNAVFKDYFRGLYFQISNPVKSSLATLNFAKGVITIYYKEDKSETDSDGHTTNTRVNKTFAINLTGNTVSLLTNEFNNNYLAATASPNTTEGDPRLYLKGGEGSMALIDLFGPDNNGNNVADELETIKNNKWLVNEANLTFYLDAATMGDAVRPRRIYLYDVDNKRQLYDYATDGSSALNPKDNKSIFGGIIEKQEDGTFKYKIRITNHIRNLITKDSVNVRLGLVVTESIADVDNLWLKAPFALPSPVTFPANSFQTIDRIPRASVMNPFGTVLYGNNIPAGTADYDKRLRLEIYYTKPN